MGTEAVGISARCSTLVKVTATQGPRVGVSGPEDLDVEVRRESHWDDV